MNSKIITSISVFLAYMLFSNIAIAQENSNDSVHRDIQISFVPYFGTNGVLTDKSTNRISINILGGVVNEVTSCEFGGMFNIVKKNVSYCQLAGMGNIVLGKVTGFQAAGNVNIAQSLDGMQISGIMNTAGYAKGMQISGLANHFAKGNCSQIAGLVNNSGDEAEFQIAGLVNNCNETKFQIAGLANHSKKVDDFQIAGLVNSTLNETNLQIAGLVNNSPEINSLQIAGLVNNANKVNGSQISGLINRAHTINGLQLGVINIADTINGVAIGVVNFARNGYHTLELSGDELFYTNIGYRSGVTKFHTILTAGIQPNTLSTPLWTYGAGAGSLFHLTPKSRLGIDMTFQHILKQDFVDNNYLYKIGCGIDHKLGSKTSLYLGVTCNFLVTDKKQLHYTEYYDDVAPFSLYENENSHFNLKSWVGFKLGIRFF